MSAARIRLGVVGVGHWHNRLFLNRAALEEAGVEIAWVTDPDQATAERYGERFGCAWSTDYHAMSQQTRPDFAFALGRHVDMAAEAEHLLGQGIPFMLEKPGATSGAELRAVCERTGASASYVAVGLVFRQSELLDALRELGGLDEVIYASLRFLGGSWERYADGGYGWLLDPRTSGGGCTVNLGIHFYDLFRLFSGGQPISVMHSAMFNHASSLPVEDYAAVGLRAGDTVGLVESGYSFPAPADKGKSYGAPESARPAPAARPSSDLHLSVRARNGYVEASGPSRLTLVDQAGRMEERPMKGWTELYSSFVTDLFRRFRAEQPPLAGLPDLVAAMELIDLAYERSVGYRRPTG